MNTKSIKLFSLGFTLVELIVVIAIMSIIAVVAMSRFNDANTFNGLIVRDQIISLSRTAQQNSFGRADVIMTITPDAGGNNVTIATSFDDGGGGGPETVESVTTSMSTLSLSGDRNETDSCGLTAGGSSITNSNPMTFTFGELGDIASPSGVTGSTGDVDSGLRVCINNDPALSICMSPSGFAYAGDCDV